MPRYVLDTGAILAFVRAEEGGDTVRTLLYTASRQTVGDRNAVVLLPFMALMEARYVLVRSVGQQEVNRVVGLVEHWPAQVVESTPDWRREAARVKALGGLSVANAWIAALALLEDAELVHRDPEFDRVPGLKTLRLPYRRGR